MVPKSIDDLKLPDAINGYLTVTCWCENSIVQVTPAEIRASRTRSCQRPECKPPEGF